MLHWLVVGKCFLNSFSSTCCAMQCVTHWAYCSHCVSPAGSFSLQHQVQLIIPLDAISSPPEPLSPAKFHHGWAPSCKTVWWSTATYCMPTSGISPFLCLYLVRYQSKELQKSLSPFMHIPSPPPITQKNGPEGLKKTVL